MDPAALSNLSREQLQAMFVELLSEHEKCKCELNDLTIELNATVDEFLQTKSDLERAIVQRESMQESKRVAEESARLKSEFLATMSHELRTPLNAIIGFSDILLMGMSGELNPKQRHKMERLRENGVRLLALINNILDLSRLEAKRVEITNAPFNPHELVQNISAQMEILAQKKNLSFYATLEPTIPVPIIGDAQRIEQVMINLLSNAFKFTEHGSVTLSIHGRPFAKSWQIRVADTGVGIPPHAINTIFEVFRQVDSSPTRAHKGSGLGLSIVRNLVELMSGKIEVNSILNQGSVFVVTLPMLSAVLN